MNSPSLFKLKAPVVRLSLSVVLSLL